MKCNRCTHCGKKIDPECHDFDKDGYPICHECWVVEDELLNLAITKEGCLFSALEL